MRNFLKNLASLLTLFAAITAIRADSRSLSISATSSATLVEPANIHQTILSLTTSAFVSTVTGDLIIRIPTATAPSLAGDENLYIAVAVPKTSGCLSLTHQAIDCTRETSQNGLLNGDPVTSLDLHRENAPLENGDISVTVMYN